MIFKLVYCIYLVICLFFGVVPIFGAITLRHAFTILMVLFCFYEGGVKLDKFLKWYMVFLFFYVLVEVASGFSSIIFSKLLGTYLASFTLYMATKTMIKKYDAGMLIIGVLVACGVVNSVVAIAQFYGSPLAQTIPDILHIDIAEEELDMYEREDLHGSYVGGLMGIVISGYFLSATSVLALYNRKGKIKVYNWIIFAVIFFALFLVQERSGVAAGLMCAFLFLALVSVRNRKTLVTSSLVLIVAFFVITKLGPRFVSFEDTRYVVQGMTDENRINHARSAIEWVLHNPMGGADCYYFFGGYYPHNFFANALLYGGVYGGTVLIGIMIAQLVKIGKVFLSYSKGKISSVLLVVSCVTYLCYTINSFFHNYSLVMGGEMIFLLWAMISSLLEREKRRLLKRRLLKRRLQNSIMKSFGKTVNSKRHGRTYTNNRSLRNPCLWKKYPCRIYGQSSGKRITTTS